MQLPTGLEIGYMAAAVGVTHTAATAVGFRQAWQCTRLRRRRAFVDGVMVLKMDLDVSYGPVMLDDYAYWCRFRKVV